MYVTKTAYPTIGGDAKRDPRLPNEPSDDWEARCLCGWWGSRDEGFFHAREHRVALIFREPINPVQERMRPPRTVREALTRNTTQISTND